MKLLRTLASALCLAFLFTPLLSKAQTLDPTQVYTTGNIVQNTPQGGPTPWVGGVYQDNLTCWGQPGDTGYCGPNAIVRPGNVINFSYGSTYLYQQQHISTLLPPETGLQVNGYNFSFRAKNGNGWDDGRTDSLMALVRLWDNTNGRGANNLLYGNAYNLNYKFNWTDFNYSETFTKPLAVPSIGQVQYGFIGRDNNGWAGPYGPEVINVNFNLKYSVNPCTSNVLSSPTCPGYLEALAKLAPPPISLVSEPLAPPPPMFADSNMQMQSGQLAPPPGNQPPPPGSPAPLDNTQAPQPPMQQAGPAPAGAPSPIQQQTAAAQPSATQTKIGEVSDSSGGSKSTVSLSSVLSMIGSNQEKTAALERSVVQAADAQAFSAGETAKATAEKIAGDAQSQSIAVSNSQATSAVQSSGTQSASAQAQSGAIALQGNLQSNTALNTARQDQANASASAGQQSTGTTGTSQQQSTAPSATRQDNMSAGYQFSLQAPKYEAPKFENSYTAPTATASQYQPPVTRQEFTVAMVTPQVSYSLFAPARYTPQVQIEPPTTDGIKFGYRGPLDNAMDSRPVMPQASTNSQQSDAVKKNVQNNEAAGNVTIDSIAKQPANYAQYFSALPDTAFYAPKEIYRNQRTVDNARTLRGLQGGSDRLHQEMINQQYK
jgi:hypothetical protein